MYKSKTTMENWLKENWFKLGILVAIFVALTLFFNKNGANQNLQNTVTGNATTQNSSNIASATPPANANPPSLKKVPAISPTNSDIGASEIDPLLTGVVEIYCGTIDGTIQGSGSLWKFGNEDVVLTNKHVLSSAPNSFPASSWYADGSCVVILPVLYQGKEITTLAKIYPADAKSWNSESDAAILDLVLGPPCCGFRQLYCGSELRHFRFRKMSTGNADLYAGNSYWVSGIRTNA